MDTSLPLRLSDEECRQPKYFCNECLRWKRGKPDAISINDIGFLSGSLRIVLLCRDCGSPVGSRVLIQS